MYNRFYVSYRLAVNLREKRSCESEHVAIVGGSSSLQGRGEAEAADPGELVSSRT